MSGAGNGVASGATSGAANGGIDLGHLRQWVGCERRDDDIASLRHARLMAATVDRRGPLLAGGDPLPPLWHWIYFLEAAPPAALGRDGHPARGGFLPPVPLPNRLWAGGEVRFEAPLALGSPIAKRSRVAGVELKRGRSGELVFVDVDHEVFAGGRRCVHERQTLVYKAATAAPVVAAAAGPESPGAAARPGSPAAPAKPAAWEAAALERYWTPDATQLFRYSALTFNGHRIHYDADYCREIEGYPGLVVHGPLIATQLAALAVDALGAPLRRFGYRALRPFVLGSELLLAARIDAGEAAPTALLRARLADGRVVMQAEARA